MNLLNTFPIRTVVQNDSDDDDLRVRKKKQKRPVRIEIEEQEEEDEDVLPKRQKYDLGFNLQDDYIEIPEIQNRILPREDGLQWRGMEATEAAAEDRPYGKSYLKDMAERQRILSNNKDTRFASELAGALRKDLSDIVEPEDMARLRQEQDYERLQTEIELKRTRVDMDKKYEHIQKLKEMAKDEARNKQTRRALQAPYSLRSTAKYLVDNDDLPSTTLNSYYGFKGLVALADAYGVTRDKEARRTARNTLAQSVLESESMDVEQSEEWLDLFLAVFTYYRDFLNNESDYSLQEAITTRLSFVLDHYNELLTNGNGDAPLVQPIIKKEEGVSATDGGYEAQLRSFGFSDTQNPLILLRGYFDDLKNIRSAVDWPLYKSRQTETINMLFFEAMGISKPLEVQMAKMGAEARYGEDNVQIKKLLTFLYGTAQEKDNAGWSTSSSASALTLLAPLLPFPEEIDTLIKVQFPRYTEDRDGDVKSIELLLRSHLLWLFFDEEDDFSWQERIEMLMPERTKILEGIESLNGPLKPIIDATLVVYKTVMLAYLRRLADLLYARRVDDIPVVTLNPAQRGILFPTMSPSSAQDFIGESERFDKLNELFKEAPLDLKDFIQDPLFYAYLVKGVNAFEDPTMSMDIRKDDAPELVSYAEYPVLRLHSIFKIYEQYLNDYANASTNNLARINSAIDKATKKIADVVGDESYSLNRNTDYRQRKAFTTRPENSGFIKLRGEIIHLLRKAYSFVEDYAESLRGLPFEAYQSDQAYEVGLSTDFITFVAVLAANLELMFPDGYRSQKYYTKVQAEKQAAMARLRRYSWEGGQCGRPYVIRKDVCMRPFFASKPQYRNHMMF